MAAVGIHVVTVYPMTVDNATGAVIDKNSHTTTINQMKNTRTEPRVVVDAAIASSVGSPTIKMYLEAEAALGYKVQHLSQGLIITYNG